MSTRVGLFCVLVAGCSLPDVIGAGAMPGSGTGGGSSGPGTDDGGSTLSGTSLATTSGPGASTGDGASSTGAVASSGSDGSTGSGDTTTAGEPGCGAVDLLIVVNSGLGGDEYVEQLEALAPDFLAELWAALPPSIDLHVGVTLSDFSDGMGCTRTVIDCVIQESPDDIAMAYIEPDEMTTQVPGGQGRLREHDMLRYFKTTTDADPTAASAWLAGLLGGLGSDCPLSMSAAAAGWAVDPVNDAANTGFLREDAVLAILIVEEGPDAAPEDPAVLISRVTDAKQGCTGCIVAAGVLGTCVPVADDALWGVLEGLHPGGLVADIDSPSDFEDMVTELFPSTVAATCATAIPPG